MQIRPLQVSSSPSVREFSDTNFKVGQWTILHTANGDYAAKVEKLRDFDGHWQVRVYVPALGKSIWQYWNHIQSFQLSAQFASVGNRVRFIQKNACVTIGEIIAADSQQVLIRVGDYHSQAIPRIALVEIIGRLH